jgi:FkbM family methyltransferase
MKYYILSNITRVLLGKLKKYHKEDEQLLVFTNDFIGAELYAFGVYEKNEIETIISSLDFDLSKNNVLDIGANIGNHSVQFSNYFNMVYCFEPNKIIYEVLEINIRKHPNIYSLNVGLSDENKNSYLSIPNHNFGGAAVTSEKEEDVVEIYLKVLDDFFNNEFSLVKIDIEGHEPQALRGMRKLLEKNKPVICFELINTLDSGQDIIKELKELGYQNFYIPYEPGFFMRRKSNSFTMTFLYGLFFKQKRKLVEVTNFNKRFYNLILCEQKDSKYRLKKDSIRN